MAFSEVEDGQNVAMPGLELVESVESSRLPPN